MTNDNHKPPIPHTKGDPEEMLRIFQKLVEKGLITYDGRLWKATKLGFAQIDSVKAAREGKLS